MNEIARNSLFNGALSHFRRSKVLSEELVNMSYGSLYSIQHNIYYSEKIIISIHPHLFEQHHVDLVLRLR